jgi:hypothetical protein
VADHWHIQVPNDWQLEELTRLRLWANRRAQARRAILQEAERTMPCPRTPPGLERGSPKELRTDYGSVDRADVGSTAPTPGWPRYWAAALEPVGQELGIDKKSQAARKTLPSSFKSTAVLDKEQRFKPPPWTEFICIHKRVAQQRGSGLTVFESHDTIS